MGRHIFSDLVTEGLELAGNTGLTTRAEQWLWNFLAEEYAKWDWPFLPNRFGPVNLSGASMEIGNGLGGITTKIAAITRIELANPEANSPGMEIPIIGSDSLMAEQDPDFVTSSTGRPLSILVSGAGFRYRWVLKPQPACDKAYPIIITARTVPEDVDRTAKPHYPNDATMIHAVYVQALRHQNDERFAVEYGALRGMVVEDRVTYGQQPGQGDRMMLSRRTFRKVR